MLGFWRYQHEFSDHLPGICSLEGMPVSSNFSKLIAEDVLHIKQEMTKRSERLIISALNVDKPRCVRVSF